MNNNIYKTYTNLRKKSDYNFINNYKSIIFNDNYYLLIIILLHY